MRIRNGAGVGEGRISRRVPRACREAMAGANRSSAAGCAEAVAPPRRARSSDYACVNIGTGGPPSLGLNTTLTFCPMRIVSDAQSTMLVIMLTPSSRVT